MKSVKTLNPGDPEGVQNAEGNTYDNYIRVEIQFISFLTEFFVDSNIDQLM